MSLIVAFEGIDGSGKSTQIDTLAAAMRMRGRSACIVKAVDRQSAFFGTLESLLDVVPRSSYCDIIGYERHLQIIRRRADLAAVDIVIFDRYTYTNYAYSCAYGIATDFCEGLIANTPPADLLVFCDVPVDVAIARISERPDVFLDQENEVILAGARTAYRHIMARVPGVLWLNSAEQAPAECASLISGRIEELLRARLPSGPPSVRTAE